MADLQFQEERSQTTALEEERGFCAWLMRKGIARDAKQAAFILVGVVGVACVIMLILWRASVPGALTTPPAEFLAPSPGSS